MAKLARELRKDQTSAEALLWDLLRDRKLLGFKFRPQHPFGKYIADFYCREAQLVIECDGSVHRGRDSWHHDQNRDTYLINQGLVVMRLKNEEILNETDRVLSEIAARLAGRLEKKGGDSVTFRPSPKGRGS